MAAGRRRLLKIACSIMAAIRRGKGSARLAAVATCISVIALPSAVALGRPGSAPSAASVSSVLRLLNAERSKRGLRPLRENPLLAKAALWQTHDMVARRYFAHQRQGGPDFVARIRRTGYLSGAKSWALGENIAAGEGSSSVESLVRAWMASPGHRHNILSKTYRDIGIGLVLDSPYKGASAAAGGPEALTITTDFGRRFVVR